MSSFQNIVVPTDFSDNARAALAVAARLARDLGATVTLLHVVPDGYLRCAIDEGLLAPDDTDETIRGKVEALVRERFDAFVAGSGLSHAGRAVRAGNAARRVVEFLGESGADLCVVGRRGTTLADVLLGSVAERVVRHAPCPVVVARPGAPGGE